MYFEKINYKLKNNMNLLFFTQRFLEMTSYMSSESYKSRMMMILALLEEYEKVYNLKYETSKKENLKIISEELVETLRKDKIAKSFLRFNIDDYIKKGLNDYQDIDKQLSVIKLLAQEITYSNYISESIKQIEIKIHDSNKDEVTLIINNLISLLNQIGIKNSYLFYSCKEYFSNQDDSTIKGFFQKIILVKPVSYKVYIGMRKLPKFIDKELFKIIGFEVKIIDNKNISPLKGFYKVIELSKVEANNPYTAIELGLNFIEQIKQAHSVFNHSQKIVIGNTHLAFDTDGKKYMYKNEISSITHQKKDNLTSDIDKFKNFLQNINLHNNSLNKFYKAIKLHNDAINSTNMENQLIFFWNALETLSIKNKNKSIIYNVEKFILPFIRKRYFSENFTYIFNTILSFKKEEMKDFFIDNNIELNMINFAKLIILEKFNKERNDFFKILNKDFPLFIDRIYQMNKQLSSPNQIQNKLDKHEENVKKQLSRIYRYRNLIIHDDSNELQINTLISNLHNYFDYLMDEIIIHSSSSKSFNIEELGLYIEMEISHNKFIIERNDKINEDNFKKIFMLD